MENFVVSARKYRPAKFEDVVGQENVTTTLKNAIRSGHLAHSFLFCGPRGVGKTTCARILAKVINCEHPTPDIEACEQCGSCRSFNNSASFNIFEIDAASNSHVEDIRSLIEQVRYAPQAGKYKIYIIDEVHMLSQSAFNAFLKTLEEPPSYAIFILATTEKHKIIPTILSRCQIFDFSRIRVEDTVKHLQKICKKENIEAEEDALHIIAQKSDGALRDALSMLDRIVSFSGGKLTFKGTIENLNILDYDYYFKATDYLLAEDAGSILLAFNEIMQKGFEGDNFIIGLAEHFRNLLVCKDAETIKLLEVSDKLKERYRLQSALAPASFLLTALNIANECDVSYKASKNKRLQVEMALIKMAHIPSAVKLAKNSVPPEAKKKELKGEYIAPEKKAEVSFAEEKKVPYQPPPPASSTSQPPPASSKPAEPKPVAATSNKTSSIKLTSLESIEHEVIQEENSAKEAQVIDYSQTRIDNGKLTEAWEQYVEQLKEKKPSLHAFAKNIQPALTNLHTIELTVENKVQHELIEKEKDNMSAFFKQELTQQPFIITCRIEKKESANAPANRAYTTTDKFKEMVKKNPALMDLKNRLGMDLEL